MYQTAITALYAPSVAGDLRQDAAAFRSLAQRLPEPLPPAHSTVAALRTPSASTHG